MEVPSTIYCLPDDVLVMVAKELKKPKDLIAFSKACKRFYAIVGSSNIDKHLVSCIVSDHHIITPIDQKNLLSTKKEIVEILSERAKRTRASAFRRKVAQQSNPITCGAATTCICTPIVLILFTGFVFVAMKAAHANVLTDPSPRQFFDKKYYIIKDQPINATFWEVFSQSLLEAPSLSDISSPECLIALLIAAVATFLFQSKMGCWRIAKNYAITSAGYIGAWTAKKLSQPVERKAEQEPLDD